MKKLLYILLVMLLLAGCRKNAGDSSPNRTNNCPYPIHDARGNIECYGSFERYMWDEGFPDTIIVPFTRNGKFERYVKAVRKGLLEDSLGNYYSPAYVFISGVGDMRIYDIKGKFVEFGENLAPHSGQGHLYNP